VYEVLQPQLNLSAVHWPGSGPDGLVYSDFIYCDFVSFQFRPHQFAQFVATGAVELALGVKLRSGGFQFRQSFVVAVHGSSGRLRENSGCRRGIVESQRFAKFFFRRGRLVLLEQRCT
jgi:hypothetical protein